MPTTTLDVRTALIAQLATLDGSGTNTYDLSPPRQVLGGKYDRPPGVVPFACVWLVQVDEEAGPPLTNRQQVATYMIKIWTSANAKDPQNRQDAAERMLHEARTALRADRLLGGRLVLPMSISGAPFDDAESQSPNKQAAFGITLLAVSATWRE